MAGTQIRAASTKEKDKDKTENEFVFHIHRHLEQNELMVCTREWVWVLSRSRKNVKQRLLLKNGSGSNQSIACVDSWHVLFSMKPNLEFLPSAVVGWFSRYML